MTDKEKDIRHSHAPKFKKDIPMPHVKPAPTTTCNDKKIKINSELYEIVFTDITVQFGAGDYIEPGDRETCAEMIVEDLEKAGYRKADAVVKDILRDIDNLAAQYGLDKFRAVELRKYAKRLGVEVDE